MPRTVREPPPGTRGAPADPERVARTIALRRLESQPRTRAELAKTLRERDVPDEVADRVLDRFEEVGLVDDRVFARMWVQSRQSGRGLSARALQAELRRRGVADDVIADAVAEIGPEAERRAALEVARRKARAVAGLPRQVQVRRLMGALARKGYGPGIAGSVVREVLDESSDELTDPGLADP